MDPRVTRTESPEAADAPVGISRRALLWGGGAAAASGALAATAVRQWTGADRSDPPVEGHFAPQPVAVAARGAHQAGITRPEIPQRHSLVAVADLDISAARASLATLGQVVIELGDADASPLNAFADSPGDLTVTVGLGPAVLASTRLATLSPELVLPSFRGDDAITADRNGGDLLLSISASDPSVLEPALAALRNVIAGFRLRWSELGFRSPSPDDVSRNPLGYHDGVIVPRTADELDENVWIDAGPAAGGTICVIRRLALDTTRFSALAPTARDAVIGRSQRSGAPLSGGVRADQVDLHAKSDDGEFLIPARSHARAAHPSFTGSSLMLRRSYSYRASDTDHGLLFIAYQRDAATFARTQLRLDEADDLMHFATPTASGAFLILPGMLGVAPLGSALFD
ncbi:Dyp-type peroxidase [Salinibacterium sp. ZJ77]|uniref:Dyp-type peroxidase n=1 Tax=Salinibacterium sp. ZJ77 TaxID=2708337 RepID=UPI002443DA39|nr:Dyp-type peroxidase [Salinibacterium sp. ZJ77]